MKKICPILVIAGLMLTMACGKKEQTLNPDRDLSSAGQQAKDTVVADSIEMADSLAMADTTDTVPSPRDILGIREVWRERTITLDDDKVNIQSLAKAFCMHYPGFSPDSALLDYLNGKSKTTAVEEQEYVVTLEAVNGYVAVEATTELPTGTTICFWNKRGGRKLMGVWMEQTSETEKPQKQLLFYDYDPQTKTLTPQAKLVDELERITKKFKSWSLRLPAEGKDIEIMEFSGEESSDTYKCTYYTWKWNGAAFHFDPNGHE